MQIATCDNQDPLKGTTGQIPLFGIDVWEHTYYLQYKKVRPDYVKAIFDIANWKDIGERFQKAKWWSIYSKCYKCGRYQRWTIPEVDDTRG